MLLSAGAQAKPEYARKEKRACGYCHVDPKGGGSRNLVGMFYGAHNHTFEGFDEEKVTGKKPQKKTGPPAYVSAWKMEMPAGTVRAAVADLAGDGKGRIVTLGDGNIATVNTVSDAGPVKEASVDLGAGAKTFYVTRLTKGKPAQIISVGTVVYRDGAKYTKRNEAGLKEITGTVRFADGTENVFFFAGGPPDTFCLNDGPEKPVTKGGQLGPPDQSAGVYYDLVARLPKDLMAALGAPEATQKIGVVGFIDPRESGTLYSWLPVKEGEDFYLVVANQDALSPTGQAAELKPVWKSPKLSPILDVAVGTDPKGSKKAGFFVLQATGADGKGRTLEFFALD